VRAAALSATPELRASATGQQFATLPIPEAVAALGRLYTQSLPPSYRAAQGIFYTPPSLVRRLLDQAERAGHTWQPGRVIDPSCGGGAFMVEAAIRMLAAMPGAEPVIALSSVGSRLSGWDLDPFAVWLANLAVEAVTLPLVAATGRRLAPVAHIRDTLQPFDDMIGKFALVMGNPPFGKVKDTAPLRARFQRSLYGHPNLYGLFTDLAVHLAKDDGIIAYLTPASFLAGQYFQALRRTLRSHAPPRYLDIVDSRKDAFADVLQEVALSVFHRGGPCAEVPCAVIDMAKETLNVRPTGSLLLPRRPSDPWILPRDSADAALVAQLNAMPHRLADWGYTVSTGPLVWNRHKHRLHASPANGRVPVVWAEAVTQDGRFILRATKRNHAPWFEPRGADDPNIVSQPCVLVQRTTAKEQRRRLVSAELPRTLFTTHPAVAVENHLNMVRPRQPRPKVPLSKVAAFFSTAVADRVFRCMNASVAVSATELESMPLPAPHDLLAAMSSADPEVAIARLYGLES
jgi:adenine-specific DNA-methyltransferase